MIELPKSNAQAIGAGHSFLIFFGKEFYPLNVLNAVKTVPEVYSISCATANAAEMILAATRNCPLTSFLVRKASSPLHNSQQRSREKL